MAVVIFIHTNCLVTIGPGYIFLPEFFGLADVAVRIDYSICHFSRISSVLSLLPQFKFGIS